jgi:hypothetical protein
VSPPPPAAQRSYRMHRHPREESGDAASEDLQAINANLVAKDLVHTDDVFVIIAEVGRANVSFGRGLAQRASDPEGVPTPAEGVHP